jgi:hypothetical protein
VEKNNIISEKELNKIMNLIESKHVELISEQNDALRATANKIQGDIRRATSGGATNEDLLLKSIQQINSLQLYNAVNGLIKQTPIGDNFSILEVLNDELGMGDVQIATQIKQALAKIGKNITFQTAGPNIITNSFKIAGTASATAPVTLDPMAREQLWQTTFSCVTKQPGAKAYKLKDGTTTYNVGGVFYYNGGRKKLADGTMANYSCTTEFKTNTSGTSEVKKKSNLGPRFAKSAQSLGIQNGKMDVATLQKILTSLEGGTPKAKTASDFAPQGVPQDAFNQQAPPTDNVLTSA